MAEDPPPPDHAYEYAVVPPEADAVAEPSLPPLQLTLVGVPMLATNKAGSVMVMLEVSVHPFASVTVTVYVPAPTPVIDSVVAELLHA